MTLLLLVACSDDGVTKYNTAPGVSILSPADGSAVEAGTLVEFQGLATDGQDLATDLVVLWSSSLDGDLGSDPPDVSGNVYLATDQLTAGSHVVTLSATDGQAETATTSIQLSVGGAEIGGPTVVILGPTEGQVFQDADAVNLIASVTDLEDTEDSIRVELVDVPDGVVWTGSPTSTGSLTVPLDPSIGAHSLTLNAVDADDNTASASVAFTVEADDRPRVAIDAPADGSTVDLGAVVTFRGTVSDDVNAPDDLAITWSSDLSGVFSTNPADSGGTTSIGAALGAGVHTITLAAQDADGNRGSDSIVLTVEDPLDRDDDLDGYSEHEGDCDDADGATNPGASEVCDDIDNDCDGFVNETYDDTYEPNETMEAAWDAGDVDGFLWTGSSLDLSALTFSSSTDEDWIKWDANDEFIVGNVSINVSATGFSGKGNYVLELWWIEENRKVDSDSGYGSLAVSYEGDPLDEDEDHWAVRLYPSTWPTGSCATTYDLLISS